MTTVDDTTSPPVLDARPSRPHVQGHCPACGWESLILQPGGYIVCTRLECPRPTVVDELLADKEVEHLVELGADGFRIRHPLRECIGDEVASCDLPAHVLGLAGPPYRPGRHRVRRHRLHNSALTTWAWEAIIQGRPASRPPAGVPTTQSVAEPPYRRLAGLAARLTRLRGALAGANGRGDRRG